jgi:uncharacterized membrane protein YqhA
VLLLPPPEALGKLFNSRFWLLISIFWLALSAAFLFICTFREEVNLLKHKISTPKMMQYGANTVIAPARLSRR